MSQIGHISNRIKEIRERRGFTQPELAKKVGTGRSQIAKLERGDRQLTQQWMVRISKALECEPPDLLPGAPVITERERAVLGIFNKLTPEQQNTLMKVATALSEPVNELDSLESLPKNFSKDAG